MYTTYAWSISCEARITVPLSILLRFRAEPSTTFSSCWCLLDRGLDGPTCSRPPAAKDNPRKMRLNKGNHCVPTHISDQILPKTEQDVPQDRDISKTNTTLVAEVSDLAIPSSKDLTHVSIKPDKMTDPTKVCSLPCEMFVRHCAIAPCKATAIR